MSVATGHGYPAFRPMVIRPSMPAALACRRWNRPNPAPGRTGGLTAPYAAAWSSRSRARCTWWAPWRVHWPPVRVRFPVALRWRPVAELAKRHGAPVLEVAHVRRGAVLVGFRAADIHQDVLQTGQRLRDRDRPFKLP